jgi:hypothetical protein
VERQRTVDQHPVGIGLETNDTARAGATRGASRQGRGLFGRHHVLTRGTRLMIHECKLANNLVIDGPLTTCLGKVQATLQRDRMLDQDPERGLPQSRARFIRHSRRGAAARLALPRRAGTGPGTGAVLWRNRHKTFEPADAILAG